MANPPDISVIISTRNRSDSLRVTLEALTRTDRAGLRVEVVVVDNNSGDDTRAVAESFIPTLSVRYLFEPKTEIYGKSHALNRALDSGGLGDIVAVLDDDITPANDWFQGVHAICRRWPGKDIFTGKSRALWPQESLPGWARSSRIRGWIFSVAEYGDHDQPLEEGRWFSGNHFWFRSRVLGSGRRFKDIWLTEPDFILQLVEDGYEGMYGPDAAVEHRVQPTLLDRSVAVRNAARVGRSYAELRLCPYKRKVKQARLFNEHPVVARLFCLANGARWWLAGRLAALDPDSDRRFVRTLVALERTTTYFELCRVANRMPEYRVIHRSHPAVKV